MRKRYQGKTIPEKYALRVIKGEGCWSWDGGLTSAGYTQIRVGDKTVYGHRVSYEIHFGKIPAGSEVMHTCDNPACTNPKHLILGSHLENMLDAAEKGRMQRGETHTCAKLNKDKVKCILDLLASGISPYAIAKIFSVSAPSIYDIRDGRSWKWLKHES